MCLESTASNLIWIQGQINLGVDTPARGCYNHSIIRKQKEGKMANLNSRDEALELVENGVVSAEAMLTMALKYMRARTTWPTCSTVTS